MEEVFVLTGDDHFAISIAENIARQFLTYSQITPRQIVGLGNALYTLRRLPKSTPGAYSSFGISYSAGTEDFREMRYIEFTISDTAFEISQGGSVYTKGIGGDSYSEPGWLVELGGYRETDCDLSCLEDSIAEYLNLGAEITAEDSSEIDMEGDE